MIRRNIYLTEPQWTFLQSLVSSAKDITISEHIRRGLDKYINDIKKNNISSSLSERRGNEQENIK